MIYAWENVDTANRN